MKNKLFKPNKSKLKFQIVIDVFENCSEMKILTLGKNESPSYQEMIGTLETNKMGLIFDQREINKQHLKND